MPLLLESGSPTSRLYFCCIVALGCGILGFSIYQIVHEGCGYQWLLLASLTAVSERFTVPIPGARSRISVAETFIYTNMILFGPAVGSVTAALDGLLGVLRAGKSARRLQQTVFNSASMALSAYLAGKMLFAFLDYKPIFGNFVVTLPEMILPVGMMALTHYLTNTLSVAGIIALEGRRNVIHVWRHRFLWTWVTYLAGASAATLIAINVRSLTPAVAGLVLPIVFLSYFAFKTYLEKAEQNAHRQQLDRMYMRTVEALCVAIDTRDSGTLAQAKQVQTYACELAREMGMPVDDLRGIEAAALLLDIGNLAVPDSILNKTGELSSTEFQKVMTHPAVGASIVSTIDFPYPVADYVLHHHERWDGSGYPDGLKGTEIPLGARILALADSYGVLTSDRPYHKARSREEALREISAGAGTIYDPELVQKFLRVCGASNEEEGAPLTPLLCGPGTAGNLK